MEKSQDIGDQADGGQWFVLMVAPRKEASISKRSTDTGVSNYYPTARGVRIDKRGKAVETLNPAIPGYVFIRVDNPNLFSRFRREWDAPEAIPGCVGWLGGPDGPRPIDAAEVEALRERGAAGEFDAVEKRGSFWGPRWLRAKARVRITDGPFRDCIGEVLRMTAARRVLLLLQFLGGETIADVEMGSVARVR